MDTPKRGALALTSLVIFGGSTGEPPPYYRRDDHQHILEMELHGAAIEKPVPAITTLALSGSGVSVSVATFALTGLTSSNV
jgi:hypothetical protein